LRACFIGLNEPDEVEVFRSHLGGGRFELVDLGARLRASRTNETGRAMTLFPADACGPDLGCDLVVISGEFAGGFFGKEGSMSLQAMEDASCRAECAGLFRQPREVFLLGCNTLATKDPDRRTREDYLFVLLRHGFDRATAERVVELRYGTLGPSFRESLRRIFAGVPRIYGFRSVAPLAEHTAPMLERYLRSIPDYTAVLGRATGTDSLLRSAFAGTSFTVTHGLADDEPAALDRDRICALYDESRSFDERLRIAYGLVRRADALKFIPALQVFLARHPSDRFGTNELSILREIQLEEDARASVLDLIHSLEVSALQLELAHFAALVGWMDRHALRELAVRGAARLLHGGRSTESVSVLCAIVQYESLRSDFTADDIPASLYTDPEGLWLLSCLAPTDPRIAPRVLPALRSDDPLLRRWAAYTLTQLRPSEPEVLLELVPYLRDPSPEIAARIRFILDVQSPLPEVVRQAVR
jgi:hypothetical protein